MLLNITSLWKPCFSLGTRPQISHRMFPLLIFVRQQHGNAYLHYRPAPRGASPKPLTQRLISSYSLLSPSSSNWEQIEGKREHYPGVSSSDSPQTLAMSIHMPLGLDGPASILYSPFPSFTVLALNHTKKKKKAASPVIYKPIQKVGC